MQAIEFVATVENGVIKVPKMYLNELEKELRVIILMDKKEPKPTGRKPFKAKAAKIKLKNFKFDREEANAR